MPLCLAAVLALLRQAAPDYCLCIHHNASRDPQYRGYEAGAFYPYAQQAAAYTVETTRDAGLYTQSQLRWYLYYMARLTTCPVVLTENGYMSNVADMEGMLPQSTRERKAKALTQGVVNYFLDISGLPVSKG